MGRKKNRVKPVPAPVVPPAVTERQKRMEDEIRLAAAWEAYVSEKMDGYGQSRRTVTRRLRYGSFVAGWKAAQGSHD